MNELQPIHETESENVAKGVPGTGTLGTAKVAGENLLSGSGADEKDNNSSVHDALFAARQIKKELLDKGELKSTAERFIENPRIHRAVRRFCYECNGFSRHHATNCESSNCALWLFRHGRTIPREEELPVWRKAHKRWLQSAGELKRE